MTTESQIIIVKGHKVHQTKVFLYGNYIGTALVDWAIVQRYPNAIREEVESVVKAYKELNVLSA